MAGDVFGRVFRVSSFGESHGAAVGCVVEGCPAGIEIAEADVAAELERRRPGAWGDRDAAAAVSPRAEPDRPELLSGVFEGRTTGAPIALVVRSVDQHSGDYESYRGVLRPGRGDPGWAAKYGHRDHRGGGRLSGRETAARVAAGAIAKKFLAASGIHVYAFTLRAAGVSCGDVRAGSPLDEAARREIESNAMRAPDAEAARRMLEAVRRAREAGDSAGGIVECRATGLPRGLGEPVFEGLDALLGGAAMSIPGVKGVEFGAGFGAADLRGSDYLDAAEPAASGGDAGGPDAAAGGISWRSNRAGGVAGGLSTGAELVLRVAVKPTPTVAIPIDSLDETGRAVKVTGSGRHDACLCPRLVPVLEAMVALVLADCVLLGRAARA
ncbi:MAG TPA: chorismate synthase [Rectinemataceae bacterium]|nr:chorismate synthase [Rectinemataceae bacterium]